MCVFRSIREKFIGRLTGFPNNVHNTDGIYGHLAIYAKGDASEITGNVSSIRGGDLGNLKGDVSCLSGDASGLSFQATGPSGDVSQVSKELTAVDESAALASALTDDSNMPDPSQVPSGTEAVIANVMDASLMQESSLLRVEENEVADDSRIETIDEPLSDDPKEQVDF